MKLSYNPSTGRRTEVLPMLRRIGRLGIGVGVLLALSSGSVLAQRLKVMLDGAPVHFEGMGPLQIEGHTMVPVRGVLEKMGAEVAWLPASQTVVASSGHLEIEMVIGEHEAKVNGRRVPLDTPAQVISGHTMVPLRFLSESLGADVRWDDASRTVIIVTHDRQNVNRPDHVDGDRKLDRDRDRDRRPGDAPPDRKQDDSNGRPPHDGPGQ
jgi:hypothetical protein